MPTNSQLTSLRETIKIRVQQVEKSLRARLRRSATSKSPLNAAVTIQRAWRHNKVKVAMVSSPYFAYLSMVDPSDEENFLFSIMFGQRQAAFVPSSKERINPFVSDKALYHRDDDLLPGPITKFLFDEFDLTSTDLDGDTRMEYIPITLLSTTPIEELIRIHSSPTRPMILIRKEGYSMGILKIAAGDWKIKAIIRASGLTASPWEIATNLKHQKVEGRKSQQITLDPYLPKTKTELLAHDILKKSTKIASSSRHSTKYLAHCLLKMLEDLPDTLSEQAMQRIAVMIDLSNTFYEHNYSRYAFCVYAIVHEISIALLKASSPSSLDSDYAGFLSESEATFLNTMGLEKDRLSHSQVVSFPAMSGTNAYAIAMKLALQMKSTTQPPTISLVGGNYYELKYVTEDTSSTDADIFVISCGPIVQTEGLMPGVDINLFVKRMILDPHRTKPTTIIIDATTTLYKNLHLNEEVKKLVEEGQLSIIIHESHQKFGLIHTDQAQYGRTFALCSNKSFSEETLHDLQGTSKEDFTNHLDLRIGAYISRTCSPLLEHIKQQHFSNGALLRSILMESLFVEQHIIKHQDMLTHLDELYFLNAPILLDTVAPESRLRRALTPTLSSRDSFGHHSSNISTITDTVQSQYRVSADASDQIDCLIQTAQIYLNYHFDRISLSPLLESQIQKKEPLTLDEQIIALAMLSLLEDEAKESLNWDLIEATLSKCPLLKGRYAFSRLEQKANEHRLALLDTSPKLVVEAIDRYLSDRPFLTIAPSDDEQGKALIAFLAEKGLSIQRSNRKNETPLLFVIRSPIDVVHALIAAGADINQPNHSGTTPLMAASSTERIDIVNTLINTPGIGLHQTDNKMLTALHHAVLNGHLNIVDVLLQAKARVNDTDFKNETPLWMAAGLGHVDIIQRLLKEPGILLNCADITQNTPLLLAIKAKHTACVNALLEAPGLELNARGSHGETALLCAAGQGNIELVRALLLKGARMDLLNNERKSPLFLAIQNGHLEAAEILIAAGAPLSHNGSPPLMLALAAHFGHLDLVKSLLAAGAEVNATNEHGATALFCAASEGHAAVVAELLRAGADPSIKCKGETAQSIALGKRRSEVITVIMEHIIAAGAPPSDRSPLLMLAAHLGHLDLVKSLLTAGAEVNATHEHGATALFCAASEGHAAVVSELLRAGADLNIKCQGKTAQSIAIWKRRSEVTTVIMEHLYPETKPSEPFKEQLKEVIQRGAEASRSTPKADG